MATNIFDTSSAVAPVTQNQTPIQSGVVDNTTAQAIEAIGKIAYKAGGDIVSQHVVNTALENAGLDSEGNLQENLFAQDPNAKPDADLPEETQTALDGMDSRLTKIKQAHMAGMNKNKAEIMARQEVSKQMRNFPMFADRIKARAAQYGIIGGLSGAGTAKASQTPEQKAQEVYLQEVSALSLKMGVSEETAANIIQQNAYYDQKEKSAQSNMGRIYSARNKAQNDIYSQVILPVIKNSPDGNIPPQLMQESEFGIRMAGNDWYTQQIQKAQEGGYLTKQYQDELVIERDDLIKSNIEMLNNKSLANLLATNKQVAENIVSLNASKTKYLASMVNQGVISTDDFKTIVQASSGDERAVSMVKSDPRLSEIFGVNDNINQALVNAKVDVGMKLLGGNSPAWDANHSGVGATGEGSRDVTQSKTTPTQQDQAFGLLLNSPQGPQMLQQALKKNADNVVDTFGDVAKSDPRAVSLLLNPRIISVIKGDKEGARVVNETLNKTSRSFAGQLYSDGWDGNIRITTSNVEAEERGVTLPNGRKAVPYGMRSTQKETTSATGGSIVLSGLPQTPRSANYRKQINNMIKVAKQYPEIWKGEYDSALEYVQAKVSMNIGKTPEERQEAMNRARQAQEEVKQEEADFVVGFLTQSDKAAKLARPNKKVLSSVQKLVDAGYTREEILEDFDEQVGDTRSAQTRAYRKSIIAALDEIEGTTGTNTPVEPNNGVEPTQESVEEGIVRDLQVLKDYGMTDDEIIQRFINKGASEEKINRIRTALSQTRVDGGQM